MASQWQLDCLENRIRSLASEIRRVSAKHHPYAEPRVVYDILLSVLDRNLALLGDYRARFSELNRQKFLDGIYDTTAIDTAEVSTLFSMVDRVDSARIPFEILRALSWAAQQLVGEKFRVVVRLDPILNYSIFSTKAVVAHRKWQKDWTNDTSRAPADHDILVLGIPSAYANSILLNALAAHEMGHLVFAAKLKELSPTIVDVYRRVREKHQHELQDYVMALAVEGRAPIEVRDAYGLTAEAIRRLAFSTAVKWCQEVYADLVAARLLGPAFLAAFDRVLVGKYPPSWSHPSYHLRRTLVNEYVDKHLPHISSDPAWTALMEGRAGPLGQSNPLWAFEDDICKAIAVPFAQTVQTIMSPFDSTPEEFAALISEMETHISNLSPPSVVLWERNKWIDSRGFWAMLYAAWRFRLDNSKFTVFARSYGFGNPYFDAEEALGNLLLQGLKTLELKTRWFDRDQGKQERT